MNLRVQKKEKKKKEKFHKAGKRIKKESVDSTARRASTVQTEPLKSQDSFTRQNTRQRGIKGRSHDNFPRIFPINFSITEYFTFYPLVAHKSFRISNSLRPIDKKIFVIHIFIQQFFANHRENLILFFVPFSFFPSFFLFRLFASVSLPNDTGTRIDFPKLSTVSIAPVFLPVFRLSRWISQCLGGGKIKDPEVCGRVWRRS